MGRGHDEGHEARRGSDGEGIQRPREGRRVMVHIRKAFQGSG